MTYAKPELVVLTLAVEAVQGTLLKGTVFPPDGSGDFRTNAAYEADE